jgi:hypothetical protein
MLNLESIKKPLLVILLAVYIVIPLAESIACDDCASPVPFQAKGTIIHSDRQQGDAALSVRAADTSDSASTANKEVKHLCPLCSNAASGMMSHNCNAPFLTAHVVSMPKLLAILDPSYPINKPPQN